MFNSDRMIQAVIFDMDGLLIDTEPKWQEIEREVIHQFGITISPEMQKLTLGLRTIEMLKFWHHYMPWPDADFEKSEKHIEELMKQYFINEAKLMNGTRQVLDFFRLRDVKLAIASSSPIMLIDTFLDKFNFHEYFVVKHSAEFEEYGKPHPGVYITTAKMLDVHPSLCLTFEDSFNGLLAAKAARMKTVVVPDPEHFSEERFSIADLKIRNLEEFGEKELYLIAGNHDLNSRVLIDKPC